MLEVVIGQVRYVAWYVRIGSRLIHGAVVKELVPIDYVFGETDSLDEGRSWQVVLLVEDNSRLVRIENVSADVQEMSEHVAELALVRDERLCFVVHKAAPTRLEVDQTLHLRHVNESAVFVGVSP